MSLHLDHITLTYPDGDGRLTALDEVSLTVPKGSITAVVGPSGSGKSSLLAVAATLTTPDTGRVVVDGVETTGLSRAELTALRRHRIGIVFQQANLLPSLTAAEQLQVMAHLDGRSPRAALPVPSNSWPPWACATRRRGGRTSSPAVSASASTSPAP